jgi:glyoxylase-like metal-dependent hydrolase (beta-lactamase superfamily II)
MSSLSPDSYTPSPTGHAFHDLYDSQIIPPLALQVLHTPGHTDDSIALYIPQDRALYTGDSVLGQGTAVFEDLALYLKSLDYMLHFGDSEPAYEKVYPGHGPVVPNGKKVIKGYITHRLEREAQILKLLKSSPPGNADSPEPSSNYWTTWTIVMSIYAMYPQSLWLPAAHGVDLHLKKLEGEGAVRRVGGEGKDTSWEILDILTDTPVDHQTSS